MDAKFDWVRSELKEVVTEEGFLRWCATEKGQPDSFMNKPPPLKESQIRSVWEQAKGGSKGATFVTDWPLRAEHFCMPESLDNLVKSIIEQADARGVLVFGPRKLGKTLLLMTIAYYVSAIRKEQHAGDTA